MMALIKKIVKFRKAKFFKNSIAIFIGILLPSVITLFLNIFRGTELPTILYVLFTAGDIFIAVFVSLFIVGNYDSNKYRLYNTLPIKYDNLFKYLYIETYLIIILAFVITGIINFAMYDIYSLFVQMFKMALALCISNAFIQGVATAEFVTSSESQQRGIIVIVLSTIFTATAFMTVLIVAGPETLSSYFNKFIANIVIIFLMISCMLIAALTVKKSYLRTMNKVRLTNQ